MIQSISFTSSLDPDSLKKKSKPSFVIKKHLDQFSENLAIAHVERHIFPRIIIDLKNPDNRGVSYELKEVMITSYQFSGTTEADSVPTEVISFTYQKIEWTYY